jgi:hypothetical protein
VDEDCEGRDEKGSMSLDRFSDTDTSAAKLEPVALEKVSRAGDIKRRLKTMLNKAKRSKGR